MPGPTAPPFRPLPPAPPPPAGGIDLRVVLAGLEDAYAPQTIRAVRSRFELFEAWCRARGVSALPATQADVAAHVAQMARRFATATIRKRLWAIRAMHLNCDAPDPTRGRAVPLALRRAVRTPGHPATPPRPLHFAEMERLAAVGPDTPRGRRDRLMVRLAYDTLCRASELVKLRMEDVELAARGTARVRVRRAKNDPLGAGDYAHISAATVAALRSGRRPPACGRAESCDACAATASARARWAAAGWVPSCGSLPRRRAPPTSTP